MVRGLEVFKQHFADYSNQYVIIGGTACSLAMEDAGEVFRGTKDIDIVLYVEALDAKFVKAFWDFIGRGKYKNKQNSTGKKLFYRFNKPDDNRFPEMLELFSRKPEVLNLPNKFHLTPIPIDEDLSSLSAILLDDNYYELTKLGRHIINGLPIVKPEYLIPLKIHAWMDLTARKAAGEKVKSVDIKKHRNDVFRLFRIITLGQIVPLNNQIKKNTIRGLKLLKEEINLNLSNLGIKNRSVEEVIAELTKLYE